MPEGKPFLTHLEFYRRLAILAAELVYISQSAKDIYQERLDFSKKITALALMVHCARQNDGLIVQVAMDAWHKEGDIPADFILAECAGMLLTADERASGNHTEAITTEELLSAFFHQDATYILKLLRHNSYWFWSVVAEAIKITPEQHQDKLITPLALKVSVRNIQRRLRDENKDVDMFMPVGQMDQGEIHARRRIGYVLAGPGPEGSIKNYVNPLLAQTS